MRIELSTVRTMRIGTLGNGLMAEALAGSWIRAGHEVMIGGRSLERATELAKRVGATAGSLAEAASYGEVVLLAVPGVVAADVARLVPEGAILIDCTNAIDQRDFTLTQDSVAEAVSAEVGSGVIVVKAFNLAADTVWQNPPPALGVPLCGEAGGVEVVAGLVRDLGCVPVAAGGLRRARLLEATAALVVGIWMSGGDVRGMFPRSEDAFGTVLPG